jgi:hypothetical protein
MLAGAGPRLGTVHCVKIIQQGEYLVLAGGGRGFGEYGVWLFFFYWVILIHLELSALICLKSLCIKLFCGIVDHWDK